MAKNKAQSILEEQVKYCHNEAEKCVQDNIYIHKYVNKIRHVEILDINSEYDALEDIENTFAHLFNPIYQ